MAVMPRLQITSRDLFSCLFWTAVALAALRFAGQVSGVPRNARGAVVIVTYFVIGTATGAAIGSLIKRRVLCALLGFAAMAMALSFLDN